MSECKYLTVDEKDALVDQGWTVISGPHATEADCLMVCSSSGPPPEGCDFCTDPLPITVCLMAADAGLTNGTWDSCVSLNENTELTIFDDCSYRSTIVDGGDDVSAYWELKKIDATTWQLRLVDVDTGLPMGPVYTLTVDAGDCTFPITLTHGAFAEPHCGDWPDELTIAPDCTPGDCSSCGDACEGELGVEETGTLSAFGPTIHYWEYSGLDPDSTYHITRTDSNDAYITIFLGDTCTDSLHDYFATLFSGDCLEIVGKSEFFIQAYMSSVTSFADYGFILENGPCP